MAKNVKKFREKEVYREKIVEMVGEIDNSSILEYLYTFIKGIMEEWRIK